MTRQDAWAEAIAQIRMAIDMSQASAATEDDDSGEAELSSADHDGGDGISEDGDDGSPTRFGASSRCWQHIDDVEKMFVSEDRLFNGLETKLRAFIRASVPKLEPELRGNIKIDVHKCVYVQYASHEDFRSARDILRCTDSWYGKPRHDCALIDDEQGDTGAHHVVRLRALLRCKLLASGDVVDIIAVTRFKPASWKPKTDFFGCRVYEERTALDFVLPKQLIRGALMCPAFGAPRKTLYYLRDTSCDGDMFLRLNNISVAA